MEMQNLREEGCIYVETVNRQSKENVRRALGRED